MWATFVVGDLFHLIILMLNNSHLDDLMLLSNILYKLSLPEIVQQRDLLCLKFLLESTNLVSTLAHCACARN